jgi:hypothetical protein
LPSAIVWTSTCGGANSGKTSTLVFGNLREPERDEAGGGEDDEPAEPQAASDDPAHAQWLPAMSSSAP